MSLDPTQFNWFYIIGVGEVSNIPNYIVYYYLKTKPEIQLGVLTDSEIAVEKLQQQRYNSKLQFWKTVQKFWFSGIRVIVGSYLTYKELSQPNHIKALLPVIPLYFLGIAWSLNMHKSQ